MAKKSTTTSPISNSKDIISIIACLEKASYKARMEAISKFSLTHEQINTVIDAYAGLHLEQNPAKVFIETDSETCFFINTITKL